MLHPNHSDQTSGTYLRTVRKNQGNKGSFSKSGKRSSKSRKLLILAGQRGKVACNVVLNTSTEERISVASLLALLPTDLFWMGSENRPVVSEMSDKGKSDFFFSGILTEGVTI